MIRASQTLSASPDLSSTPKIFASAEHDQGGSLMSFLAPLFLVGALAIGLPIVFHLIRRTTRERKVFSSLMFLMPSPPRLVQRNRIEHLLLLLLQSLQSHSQILFEPFHLLMA